MRRIFPSYTQKTPKNKHTKAQKIQATNTHKSKDITDYRQNKKEYTGYKYTQTNTIQKVYSIFVMLSKGK